MPSMDAQTAQITTAVLAFAGSLLGAFLALNTRLAKLEVGQVETNRPLDRIDHNLEVLNENNSKLRERVASLEGKTTLP